MTHRVVTALLAIALLVQTAWTWQLNAAVAAHDAALERPAAAQDHDHVDLERAIEDRAQYGEVVEAFEGAFSSLSYLQDELERVTQCMEDLQYLVAWGYQDHASC
jgi:hypothetical protein